MVIYMVDLSRYRGLYEFNPEPPISFSMSDILSDEIETSYNDGEIVGSIDKITSKTCVFLKPTAETLIQHKKLRDDIDAENMGCIYPITEEAAAALRDAFRHGGIPLYVSSGSTLKFSNDQIPTGAILYGSKIVLGKNATFKDSIANTQSVAYIANGTINNSNLRDVTINGKAYTGNPFDSDERDDKQMLASDEVADHVVNIGNSDLALIKSTGDLEVGNSKLHHNMLLRDTRITDSNLAYHITSECHPYDVFSDLLRKNKAGIKLNNVSMEHVKADFFENKDTYQPNVPPKDWDGVSDYNKYDIDCYHPPKLGMDIKGAVIKNSHITAKGQGQLKAKRTIIDHLNAKVAPESITLTDSNVSDSYLSGKTELDHTELKHVISQNDLKAYNATIDAATDHPLFNKTKLNLKHLNLHLTDGFAVLPTDKAAHGLTMDGNLKHKNEPENSSLLSSMQLRFDNQQIKNSHYFKPVDNDYAYRLVKQEKQGLYEADTDLAKYVGDFSMPEPDEPDKPTVKKESNELDL